jgi:hypothetical protein
MKARQCAAVSAGHIKPSRGTGLKGVLSADTIARRQS